MIYGVFDNCADIVCQKDKRNFGYWLDKTLYSHKKGGFPPFLIFPS